MMVVGEAGSGKSANVTILAKALSRLHSDGVEDRDGFYKQVDRLLLNPKSITAGECTTYNKHRLGTIPFFGWRTRDPHGVLTIITPK